MTIDIRTLSTGEAVSQGTKYPSLGSAIVSVSSLYKEVKTIEIKEADEFTEAFWRQKC